MRHVECSCVLAIMLAKSFAAAVAISSLFFVSVAHADGSGQATDAANAPAPAKTESRWYGYQTLATDAAAVAFLAISASADSKPAANVSGVMALGTYAIAPAVIHGIHGHAGKAVGDVAIRVLTPVLGIGLGALIGAAAYQGHDDGTIGGAIGDAAGGMVATLEGAAIGGLIGIGTAITIDAAVLAREDVPVEKKEAERPIAKAKTGPTFHPNAAPTKDGFMAGVGGTF